MAIHVSRQDAIHALATLEYRKLSDDEIAQRLTAALSDGDYCPFDINVGRSSDEDDLDQLHRTIDFRCSQG